MNYKRLIISIILPQLAGGIGSLFTTSAIATWYVDLAKPFFTPPNWLFGPAWITLYLLMGISIYLIWQKLDNPSSPRLRRTRKVKLAFIIFWIHLIINALWSFLFFGLQNPLAGLICIVVIWLMIVALMILFWPIKKSASYLLIPYWLWVSLATALNLAIWRLN